MQAAALILMLCCTLAAPAGEVSNSSATNSPVQGQGSKTAVLPQKSTVPSRKGRALAQPAAGTNAWKIPEGRILEFFIPLTREGRVAVANSKDPPVDFAKAAIAVPRGFEPDIPATILLVCGTSDGDASSIRAMQAYTNIALRLGCVVMAADGPFGKPPNDSPPWRWAMICSLLDHVQKAWPGAKRWPIVCAGVSGGGKWAGVIGAVLAQKGYNLMGVFMGAVNQDMASEAAKLYEPAVRYRKTPIYISSGTDDKIATPQQHQEVRDSLLSSGFTSVRLESFKGGHALSESELRKAINWFTEEYSKPPSE